MCVCVIKYRTNTRPVIISETTQGGALGHYSVHVDTMHQTKEAATCFGYWVLHVVIPRTSQGEGGGGGLEARAGFRL